MVQVAVRRGRQLQSSEADVVQCLFKPAILSVPRCAKEAMTTFSTRSLSVVLRHCRKDNHGSILLLSFEMKLNMSAAPQRKGDSGALHLRPFLRVCYAHARPHLR